MRYKNPFPVGVKLPEISVPKDTLDSLGLSTDADSLEILKQLCRRGLREKGIVKEDNRKEYYDRVQMEIDILADLGFVDYILLNWDILDFCKRNNIPTGAGRGCFTPDSIVTLHDGYKKEIKNVKVGDIVLDHENNPQKVIDTLSYEIDEDILELELEDGRVVCCTSDHEFYTENRGWVKASDLKEDDDIREIYADPRPKPVFFRSEFLKKNLRKAKTIHIYENKEKESL